MEILNAIILGIIQGITEFLPISSSGHLEIAKSILGQDKIAKESLLMTIVLHFATALSTIVFFRKEIKIILIDLLSFKKNSSFDFSMKILYSMIPAILVGLLLESHIEMLFIDNLTIVGYMLIVTAILLILADKNQKNNKNLSKKHSIIIGIAQAIAIIPGISRSGATISISVLLGITKEQAARFSFLMVVPLIFGKMIQDIFFGEVIYDTNLTPLLFGFIFAFITGFFACKWMIKLVQKSQLKYFSLYCTLIGSVIIFYSFY